MIRSTKHNLTIVNTEKCNAIALLLYHSKAAYSLFVDYIWSNVFISGSKNDKIFDVSRDLLDLPAFIDYNQIIYPNLSKRMLNTLSTQAIGAVSAAVEKRKKLLYGLKTYKDQKSQKRMLDKLKKYPLVKPSIPSNFSIEVSSACANFKKRESQVVFGFLTLSSLGKSIGKIIIPVQNYKRLGHYSKDANWFLKGGFLISESSIQLRWEKGEAQKIRGFTLGGDTGYKTVLTLSDGQATPHHDCHKHSLESICDKMNRKKKGSKAYRRCQIERENFINWSINQLNFTGVKQINLEKVVNIFHGKRTSKKMARWANSVIERKVKQMLEVGDVSLTFNKSAYRSQRCFSCGLVLNKNRKKGGKVFKCQGCGFTSDADLNGARNNSIDLPYIPTWLFNSKLNRSDGFFWKLNGFFSSDGQELRVPDVPKDQDVISDVEINSEVHGSNATLKKARGKIGKVS